MEYAPAELSVVMAIMSSLELLPFADDNETPGLRKVACWGTKVPTGIRAKEISKTCIVRAARCFESSLLMASTT